MTPDILTEDVKVELSIPSGWEFVRGASVTRRPAQNRASWSIIPGSVRYDPTTANRFQEIVINATGIHRWLRVRDMVSGSASQIQVWNLLPITHRTKSQSLYHGVYGKNILTAIILQQVGTEQFSLKDLQAPEPVRAGHITVLRRNRHVSVTKDENDLNIYRLTSTGIEIAEKFLLELNRLGVTA